MRRRRRCGGERSARGRGRGGSGACRREQGRNAPGGLAAAPLRAAGRTETAAQVGVDAYAAQAKADRLQRELDAAQAALAGLQEQGAGGVLQPAGAALLGGAPAQPNSTYVFPVGGGPSVVSVSHTHHDYPAADIAAPEGRRCMRFRTGACSTPGSTIPRCGMGFTFEATGRPVWTYCHLSYLYPSVQPGAQLTGGRARRSRRRHRRRHRTAPPPAAAAGHVVPAGRGSGSSRSPARPSSGRTK